MHRQFSTIKHKKSKSYGKSETKKWESRNDMFARLYTERLGSFKLSDTNPSVTHQPKRLSRKGSLKSEHLYGLSRERSLKRVLDIDRHLVDVDRATTDTQVVSVNSQTVI